MWNIIGHERAVQLLDQAVRRGDPAHAWLFTGPAGVGKTHLALELAKALNCEGDDPPCGICIHCRQIGSGSHPDVTMVERPDGKESIAIAQVRELRDTASLRPFQGRMKVYIVAGAEVLTPPAADALLKTLEEPQRQVMIVLTAPEVEALPSTIVSRCRVLPLQPVSPVRLMEALCDRGIDVVQADRLARLAQGNVGWALRAAGQPKLVEQRDELITRLAGLLDLDLEGRMVLAEALAADRKDRSSLRRALEVLILLARDLLLLTQGLPSNLAAGEQRRMLECQARRYSLAQVHSYFQGLRRTLLRIDQNVDPRLALEALFMNLP